jgi:hypothetical protein
MSLTGSEKDLSELMSLTGSEKDLSELYCALWAPYLKKN